MTTFTVEAGSTAPATALCDEDIPSLAEVQASAKRLQPYVRTTPVFHWTGPTIESLLGAGTSLFIKLELFQETGSFKARGALNAAMALSPEERRKGLTTFSSGNHAAAIAYAAKVLGTTAKVVMPLRSNAARVANCQRYGAEILRADDGNSAWEQVQEIVRTEGRAFIHPYEGFHTSCGAATIGLELSAQVPDLDAVVVSIGGGGLCSGLGLALRHLGNGCRLLAVEPEGADTMWRSFRSGRPEKLQEVRTIADSLAPPTTQPFSLALCRETVAELKLVSDDQMRCGMRILLEELSLMVEPAGAAALAGAMYAFREEIAGKKVAVIICGSNIGAADFLDLL